MGEITKRDIPAKQQFVDQHIEAPFEELGQLGQQLAKEKSQKRAALRSVSDSFLGIKAIPQDSATRDRIIGMFQKRVNDLSESKARNIDAEIAQLADDITFEVKQGELATISQNFITVADFEKRKQTARTKPASFDEKFSLNPSKKAFENLYGDPNSFVPDQSNLDESGRTKLIGPLDIRPHTDINDFFRDDFKLLKAEINQTATENKERGVISTQRIDEISNERIYDWAFNQVTSDVIRPDVEEQMRIEVSELSESKILEMAKRSISSLSGEPIDIKELDNDNILDLAVVDRMSRIGQTFISKKSLQSLKAFQGQGIKFGGRGGATIGKFNFTAKIGEGVSIGIANPFFANANAVAVLENVNSFKEILISSSGTGGTSKNKIIKIEDPNDEEKTIDVRPLSFRSPGLGGQDWFLLGERTIEEEETILDPKTGEQVPTGETIKRVVEELYPYNDIKENFANNYNQTRLEDLDPDKLFAEIESTGKASTTTNTTGPAKADPLNPIKLGNTINSKTLIIDQLYEVNGKTRKWNGTKLVIVN